MKNAKKLAYILLISVVLPFGCRQWILEHVGAGIRYQDSTHLSFVSLSLAQHGEATGKLPSNITDRDGKPLLSWRVVLLKQGSLQEIELYKQFKLDEPWNSPHNLKVAQTVPFEYIDPKGPKCTPNEPEPNTPLWTMDPKAPNYTPYLAVTGENAAFRPGQPRIFDFKDDHVAIVVVDKSDVLWTEPRDIPLEKALKGDIFRRYGENILYISSAAHKSSWEPSLLKPKYEYEK